MPGLPSPLRGRFTPSLKENARSLRPCGEGKNCRNAPAVPDTGRFSPRMKRPSAPCFLRRPYAGFSGGAPAQKKPLPPCAGKTGSARTNAPCAEGPPCRKTPCPPGKRASPPGAHKETALTPCPQLPLTNRRIRKARLARCRRLPLCVRRASSRRGNAPAGRNRETARPSPCPPCAERPFPALR